MKLLNSLIRENIQKMLSYSSARDEYEGKEGIFLDANENPYGNLNRYPDSNPWRLKQILSSQKKVKPTEILIGNGSDEIIDLVQRVFCEPKEDKIIVCPPTYGMYAVYAAINNVEVITIDLNAEFQLDVATILEQNAKVIYLCSPNNPTGNVLENIEQILKNFDGIVFVDEAYIEFSDAPSLVDKINQYANLIVCQTFSKARGLAAARIGVAFANDEIIATLQKIKPPYNISQLNQEAAAQSLANNAYFNKNLSILKLEREKLRDHFMALDFVLKVYPSQANFLLVEMKEATNIFNQLIAQQIITRNRTSVVRNCLRITVGTPKENEQLLYALQFMQAEITF